MISAGSFVATASTAVETVLNGHTYVSGESIVSSRIAEQGWGVDVVSDTRTVQAMTWPSRDVIPDSAITRASSRVLARDITIYSAGTVYIGAESGTSRGAYMTLDDVVIDPGGGTKPPK